MMKRCRVLPFLPFLPLLPFLPVAAAAAAQSPNASTIVVLVTDQSGAVVKDAKVSVVNNQTGAVRVAASGGDGSATFASLPLTRCSTCRVAGAPVVTRMETVRLSTPHRGVVGAKLFERKRR